MKSDSDTAQLEEFLKILDILIIQLDAQGNILFINEKGCELLEYNQEELTGKNWFDTVIPKQQIPEVKNVFNKIVSRNLKDSSHHKTILLTKSGQKKTFAFHNSFVLNEMQEINVLASGIDITEYVTLTEELKAEKIKLRAMFDRNEELIGLLSVDGNLIDINSTALKFTGYTANEVLNIPFWDTPWWKYSKSLQTQIKESVESAARGESVHFETLLPREDGKMHTISYSINSIKNDAGKVIFLLPQARDISQHKLIENELKSSTNFIGNILNSVMSPIFVKNEKHKFIMINDAFCTFLGRTKAELLGKDDTLFFPEDQVKIFWEKDDEVINSMQDNINEEKLTSSDGITKFIMTKKRSYIDDEGKKFLVGIITDLTQIKKMESEINQRNEELQKFNQLAVNRELRMIDLKKEINELLEKQGTQPKYKLMDA